MAHPHDIDSGSAANGRSSGRRTSSFQAASVAAIDMAHDKIFDGPGLGESVPTSTTGFARQNFRHESVSTHRSGQIEDFSQSFRSEFDLGTATTEQDAISMASESAVEDAETDSESMFEDSSAGPSPGSVSDPLLRRSGSLDSNRSGIVRGSRYSQKVYLQEEDLFLVIAGFRTNRARKYMLHVASALTLGLAWIILRWFPRTYIKFIGSKESLGHCEWVVVENQWGEVSTHSIIISHYGKYLSTIFSAIDLFRYSPDPEINDPLVEHVRFLDYRYTRFIYHPVAKRFLLNNNWKDSSWGGKVKKVRDGLDSEVCSDRLTIFGKNVIDIKEKSFSQLLIDEALHPFYIFQIMSIILWSLDEYYYYAACIFLISAISVCSTLIETKKTMRRMRDLSKFVCQVRVLRSGFWSFVNSDNLVPGDIFELSDPSLAVLPCDALMLSGDTIVNESMLTGESIPVPKTPANDKLLHALYKSPHNISPDLARHYLFCGTKIIQVRKPASKQDEEAAAVAVVTRTGFNTTKGALVRSMLFPRPVGFKFYRDSFRFIGVMTIVATIGFIYSTVNFVRMGEDVRLILLRALDLITIVVPPALPATLTIGINFAISRLRKDQIFCISPQRVNIGGKIDLMAFDKTGTLTEDGLDVLGVVPLKDNLQFDEIKNDFSSLISRKRASQEGARSCSNLALAMTACHSLRKIDDDLLGDPLDEKMFKFTQWEYTDNNGPQSLNPRLSNGAAISLPSKVSIKRVFEFISGLRRMAVLTRLDRSDKLDVFVKGAPEIMSDVCRSDSIPADYLENVMYYTHRGYRVIACAHKTIPKQNVAKLKREEVENDLHFSGLFIFENRLKSSTTGAIHKLHDATIRTVMCSGDNVLTAISVGRECGMIAPDVRVFVPHLESDETTSKQAVRWHDVDDSESQLDSRTLVPLSSNQTAVKAGPGQYVLALTGDVFRYMIDYAPLDALDKMLLRGAIYARMSPDEKHELVERLQGLDYTVGFCGDGANDCGALTAADVGISLSEAEASVAAPFTSRIFEISCVLTIIKDGRAALVTSFSCFKYMALYSAIQFTSVSILYTFGSNLGNFQFLLIDLLLILPIAVFMGRAGPYTKLAAKRPTANLVSKKVIGSGVGNGKVAAMVYYTSSTSIDSFRAIRPHPKHSSSDIRNTDNTVLFLFSCFQYILIAIVLSVGPPYRESMIKNVPFVLSILVALSFAVWAIFGPTKWVSGTLQLSPMPFDFKVVIIIAGFTYLITAMLGDRYIFLPLSKFLAKIVRRTWYRTPKKSRKRYRQLEVALSKEVNV